MRANFVTARPDTASWQWKLYQESIESLSRSNTAVVGGGWWWLMVDISIKERPMKFDLRSINFHRTFHFASFRFAFDDNLSDCETLIDLLNSDRYATRPIPNFAFKRRLRSLLERVEKGNNISREELRGTIKLAICVVQRAFREEEEKSVTLINYCFNFFIIISN